MIPLLLFSTCKKEGGDIMPELFLFDGLITTYTIGGSITGLRGSQFQLKNSGTRGVQLLPVTAPTTPVAKAFQFPSVYQSFDQYNVTIDVYPTLPTQLCAVTNPSGQIAGASVNNLKVDCVDAYLVTGTVTGLTGTGLQLFNTFTDPAVSSVPFTDVLNIGNTTTAFQFKKPVPPGIAYAVSVQTQPTNPWQTCDFGGSPTASGTIGTADAVLPTLTCAVNNYNVGVTISGLQYAGLQLSLNGGAAQSVPAGSTSFVLGSLASGTSYTIAKIAQPVGQNCSLFGPTGTVAGSNVNASISCSLTGYPAGGGVTGYSGTGLTLSMTGSVPQNVTVANGATSYVFPTALNINNTYTVSIAANPNTPWQTCTFAGGVTSVSGTVTGNFTLPQITCTTNSYALSMNISGLTYSGLTVSLNGGAAQSITAGTVSYPFGNQLSGSTYTVQVMTQPSGQTCTFPGGVTSVSATMGGAPVTLSLTCSLVPYNVGGTVSNVNGTMILTMTGSKPQTLNVAAAATTYTFGTQLNINDTYTVTITNPTTPMQLCTFAGGVTSVSGTMPAGAVTLPAITCLDIEWDVMKWDAGVWQ